MELGKLGYRRIDRCRGSAAAGISFSVLNLGHQQLTGVFPKARDENVTSGPLELVWCPESGLLQLAHSYDAQEMYGENYGYRSGLNQSMVDHLKRKIGQLARKADLKPGDTVLDIGSNDCTSLKAYPMAGLTRVGIDPDRPKIPELLSRRCETGGGLFFGQRISCSDARTGQNRDLDRDVL